MSRVVYFFICAKNICKSLDLARILGITPRKARRVNMGARSCCWSKVIVTLGCVNGYTTPSLRSVVIRGGAPSCLRQFNPQGTATPALCADVTGGSGG